MVDLFFYYNSDLIIILKIFMLDTHIFAYYYILIIIETFNVFLFL